MEKLSRVAQEEARAFIYAHARPLEQRLYAYHFEKGDAGDVLLALSAYQNPDGGFGHALEPDLRLEDSSVIATTVALQILRELEVPAKHSLPKGALRYLMTTYDPQRLAWPIIPPNVDDAPHAPWWGYDEEVAQRWGGYLINPRVEIVGYLYDYAELAPAALREQLTEELIADLEARSAEVGMFDLLCYVRLLATRDLPTEVCDHLVFTLAPIVARQVVTDSGKWEEYVLTPLELVHTPDSPFRAQMAKAVGDQLDYEIQRQQPDGSWQPRWTWGGMHPESWEMARQEWAGKLTLETLLILRNFGRLA